MVNPLPHVKHSADFLVERHGLTLFTVRPLNDDAFHHLKAHVDGEAQWWGQTLVVEHRYITSIVEQLRDDGFSVV